MCIFILPRPPSMIVVIGFICIGGEGSDITLLNHADNQFDNNFLKEGHSNERRTFF